MNGTLGNPFSNRGEDDDDDGIIGVTMRKLEEFPEYWITDVNDLSDPMSPEAMGVFRGLWYEWEEFIDF